MYWNAFGTECPAVSNLNRRRKARFSWFLWHLVRVFIPQHFVFLQLEFQIFLKHFGQHTVIMYIKTDKMRKKTSHLLSDFSAAGIQSTAVLPLSVFILTHLPDSAKTGGWVMWQRSHNMKKFTLPLLSNNNSCLSMKTTRMRKVHPFFFFLLLAALYRKCVRKMAFQKSAPCDVKGGTGISLIPLPCSESLQFDI